MALNKFIEELRWRGMIHDIMPGAEEQLSKEMTTGYVGFDPTAASLHIGNLATIMLLKHLQLAGHKPIALVGGATGMIGDPSGKSAERNLLSEDALTHNQTCIKNQLSKFLVFDNSPNAAEIVNNHDWFKEFSMLQFLRDVGKHLTVNYMMAKDSVKNRIETGISFTEFSYQLLQGYDFHHLNQTKNCKLQMGGSDQWGNITSGTELIRRKSGGEAYALTCPLITKSDGTKFGKSESGNVWLDPEMTSPYKFYQFWINCSDEDCHKLIRVFTLLTKEEIDSIEALHAQEPHARHLQKALAKDITVRVHSLEDYEMAVKASEILFSKDVTDALRTIDEKTLLSVFEGVPHIKFSKELLSSINVTDLLTESTQFEIFPSKGEARKMIQGGGVSINKEKINTAEETISYELLQDKYLIVQKGKKNYYLLEAI